MFACGNTEEEENENADRMQRFVQDISSYARQIKPQFIIIPQNGAELAFNETEPDKGILASYVDAIDGIGIEELFYDGILNADNERLQMLHILKKHNITVMVSDYVANNSDIADSVNRSRSEGFIAFPRSSNNYDYQYIPFDVTDANDTDITVLSDAHNYLYLISTDTFSSKQAMIQAISATNYDVVLIDLFYENESLTRSDVEQLKIKSNGKKRLVIAYISIGSAEKYRYYWQSGWKKGSPSWIKKNYEGYHDEYWVEFWHAQWQDIIYGNNNSYIKKIIDAGFDGAYLDNVEAYYFL